MLRKILFSLLIFSNLFTYQLLVARDLTKPALMLAKVYHQGIDLQDYWVSEKYDGVRAVWNGTQLVSRGGNIYHAPDWFTSGFPNMSLDGELWISRQTFEQLVNTVRDQKPDEQAWKKVKFMVFDLPNSTEIFDKRLNALKTIVNDLNIPWLQVVKQWKVVSHQQLMEQLEHHTEAGAEGLMLHRGSSIYKAKRNGDLLKVKPYQDAEAIIIDHIPGKGKYKDQLGALLVEIPSGKRFRIGTGFTDKERLNPPEIGTTITYQYWGKTKNGIPRFASFLRIRSDDFLQTKKMPKK